MNIEIDERNYNKFLEVIPPVNSLTICNETETEIEIAPFISHMKAVKGIEHIKHLTINYNSRLTNLNVLNSFPNLLTLSVYGSRIEAFDGIECFENGDYIDINTHQNKHRDISKLSLSNVKRVSIVVERSEDIFVISKCRSIKVLEINQAMDFELSKWSFIPLEHITFRKGKFTELGNFCEVEKLRHVFILNSRNLDQFIGDNGNVTRLVIDKCNNLDLQTLMTFEDAETIIVNSCKKGLDLCRIKGLKKLKHLDFNSCNVQLELINLKELFPNMETFHLSGLKKDFGLQLKKINPEITISSNSFEL